MPNDTPFSVFDLHRRLKRDRDKEKDEERVTSKTGDQPKKKKQKKFTLRDLISAIRDRDMSFKR